MYNRIVITSSVFLRVMFVAGILVISTNAFGQPLNPGDGIRLRFFNISDAISGDFFVQKDYQLQLPYIGDIRTESRPFEMVCSEILQKYRAIYREPELTIQPLYRINVFGEIRTPGSYYVTGVEKLSDLLAMAGGETARASLGSIYLIRENQKIDINAKEILQNGERINDIGMQSGDQVYVPRKKFLSLMSAPALISLGALLITTYSVISRNNN